MQRQKTQREVDMNAKASHGRTLILMNGPSSGVSTSSQYEVMNRANSLPSTECANNDRSDVEYRSSNYAFSAHLHTASTYIIRNDAGVGDVLPVSEEGGDGDFVVAACLG